jgi:hypothetical protein
VKDIATQERVDPPVLMHRPQRLGILPTWSFWKDPAVRANPIVRRIIVPAQAGLSFTGLMSWGLLAQPVLRTALPAFGIVGRMLVSGLAGGAIGLLSICLTYGISERLLRKKILANRRRVEALADSDSGFDQPPANRR